MKKIIFALFFLLICLAVALPSFSSQFPDAGFLYESWVENGYPDYVTGVWSTYGDMNNLTIGLVEGEEGEKGKEEILDLVERDSSLCFETQKYPRNLLMEIMNDLNGYIERGLAFSHGGLDDIANMVTITLLKDKMNDPVSEAIKTEMQEKYGEAVFFAYGDGLTTELYDAAIDIEALRDDIESSIKNGHVYYTNIEGNASSGGSNKIFFLCLLAILISIFALTVVLKKRMLQATNGEIFTSDTLNDKKIEDMIKSDEIEYPSELDKKIFEKIRK